jgi:hypothetical protein
VKYRSFLAHRIEVRKYKGGIEIFTVSFLGQNITGPSLGTVKEGMVNTAARYAKPCRIRYYRQVKEGFVWGSMKGLVNGRNACLFVGDDLPETVAAAERAFSVLPYAISGKPVVLPRESVKNDTILAAVSDLQQEIAELREKREKLLSRLTRSRAVVRDVISPAERRGRGARV